ncbi:MAG: sigma-70 family RNA polymerase sigma factor [Oscillospiraceae bacterium]|nr:sigma-70 family RNA polymerase sigma factor [Oscillospiraceae bacterium]
MTQQERFEGLLAVYSECVERLLYYKISNRSDAQDVIQETFLAAIQSFHTLKEEASFKAWILSVARHKLHDYYRKKMKQPTENSEEIYAFAFSGSAFFESETETVREALETLCEKDRKLIKLFYFHGYNQRELAGILGVPVGTVKSRLHAAKQNFKKVYPQTSQTKGAYLMKAMPKILPEFHITKVEEPVKPIICKELGAWCFVPALDEDLRWGAYEASSGRLSEEVHVEAEGRASVHGIEGVALAVRQWVRGDHDKEVKRWLVCQKQDDRVRWLSETHYVWGESEKPNPADYQDSFSRIFKTGIKTQTTFLDEGFNKKWETGGHNSGIDTHYQPTTKIFITDGGYACEQDEAHGLTGCYNVKIGDKTYKTSCYVSFQKNEHSTWLSERYINENGRTVLVRQFNKKLILRFHDSCFQDAQRPQISVGGEILLNTYSNISFI